MPVAWNKYFPSWWTNNICGCNCSSVAVKRQGFHIISCHPHRYILHIKRVCSYPPFPRIDFKSITDFRYQKLVFYLVMGVRILKNEALLRLKFKKNLSRSKLFGKGILHISVSLLELLAASCSVCHCAVFGLHVFTRQVRPLISSNVEMKHWANWQD